jgi:hypothetical protein
LDLSGYFVVLVTRCVFLERTQKYKTVTPCSSMGHDCPVPLPAGQEKVFWGRSSGFSGNPLHSDARLHAFQCPAMAPVISSD